MRAHPVFVARPFICKKLCAASTFIERSMYKDFRTRVGKENEKQGLPHLPFLCRADDVQGHIEEE
jgi:hypothetical protein